MKRVQKQNNQSSLFGILSILLLCILFGTIEYIYITRFHSGQETNKILSSEGISTNGKIISLKTIQTHGKRMNISSFPTIEFIDYRERTHEFESPYSTALYVGDVIPIRYAKNNPDIVTVVGAFEENYNWRTFLIVSGTFLFSVFLMLCMILNLIFPGLVKPIWRVSPMTKLTLKIETFFRNDKNRKKK